MRISISMCIHTRVYLFCEGFHWVCPKRRQCLTVLIAEKKNAQLSYICVPAIDACVCKSMPTCAHAGMHMCVHMCTYGAYVRACDLLYVYSFVCVCLGMPVRTYKCLWGIAAIHPLTMDGCLYSCMCAYA